MGQDKALLDWNGKPLIRHTAEALAQVFQRVITISGNEKEYAFLGLPVHPDIFPDCGPLGGIHSALSNSTTPFVFIVSCDMPFFSAEVVVEILTRDSPGEITITDDGTNTHPLVGIYPVGLLPELHDSIIAGRRQVRAFLKQSSLPLSILKFPHWREQLRNINTPPEYAAMRPK